MPRLDMLEFSRETAGRQEPRNRFQGVNSASLCSLSGRYDNPIPTRFLAPIDCLKIPALYVKVPLRRRIADTSSLKTKYPWISLLEKRGW